MTSIVVQLTVFKAPAPPPVVEAVQEVVVESAIDMASAFSVRLGAGVDQLGEYGLLAADPFKPFVPIGIRIGTGTVPIPQAVINGFATGQQVTWGEGGRTSHVITGTDVTGVMNLEEKVRPWPNLPDSVIATTIFGTYAIVPRVFPTAPHLVEPMGTTTQRGTDIRFLRRLARRNGFDCYVLPEPISGIDTGYFGPPELIGPPQAVLNVNLGALTNVRDVTVRYDMAMPTSALAANIDTTSKAPQAGAALASLQVPMGAEPSLIRSTLGAATAGAVPLVRPADTGDVLTPELQLRLQAVADRASLSVELEATTGPDVGVLRPGGLVTIRGIGRLFTGLYQLTKVHITLSEGRFEQRITARRNAVAMTGAEPFLAP